MSDIWIKTSNTATTKWRKAVNIYIKRFSSTWVAAKVIWIKNTSTGWLRVWPTSGVFAITDPFITTTASGSTPLFGVDNVPIRIGTTYYGRNGTWDPNGFSISSFNFTWAYYSSAENQPGDFDYLGNLATGVYSAPSSALTINTPSLATAVDGKYVSFRIRANASNDLYSNSADSKDSYGKIRVIRRTPINTSFSIGGSAVVGGTLSVSSAWNITEARKPDASRTTIVWYRSDSPTNIYSGGGRTQVASGVYQYTVTQADSGKYIVAEETTFNTGSDFDIGVDQFINGQNQVTAVSAQITSPYRFAFGNTLYVSSNGHIGLDSGSSSYTSMSSGRNIAIFVKDLAQYYLAEYSDNSSYYLFVRSYLFNTTASASNALDYQIRFYNDPSINYCDVFIVRKGSNVSANPDFPSGYYSSGTTGHIPSSFSIVEGSSFRVFFGDSAATSPLASWTGVPLSWWDVIQTWTYPPGADDTFTAVVTAPNQIAPIPINTSLPTLSTDTGNFSAGSTITVNPGSWSGTNSFQYELLYGNTTPIASDSSATKTLFNTNQYTITNADASNPSYFFRGRVTGYSGSGQTGNSAIALSATSARSTLNPTTTISVSAPTSTGFTVSGIAGPLTGFGGTYVNLTSIEIFNSSFSLVATITSGLPSVNGTTGAWSYTWTGGSSSTTYYARATVTAVDTAQSAFTIVSSFITTSVGTVTPTSLSATTTDRSKIRITFAGGSATDYMLYWLTNSTGAPNSAFTGFDFTTTSSPFDWTTMNRGTTYYFFVRSRTGTTGNFTYSPSWFPSSAPGVIAKAPLYAPGTPTGLNGSVISSSRIDISWTAPTTGVNGPDSASGYDVFYSTSSSNPGAFTTPTTTTTSTSLSVTGLVASTQYFFWVRGSNADNTGSSAGSWTASISRTTSAPPAVIPTITMGANTLVTQTSGRINWTSTNQASFSSNGTFAGTGTTATFVAATGLTASTTYTGTVTVTSSTGNTASANYSFRTSDPVFVVPTTSAPALQFQRVNASSIIRWYCDYPGISGNGSITGMQFEIRTTAGGGTLLASGTRAYPGPGVFPYAAAGTVWAFRMGTNDGDITFTTAARFGRARVVMQGTNGTTYFGPYSGWL